MRSCLILVLMAARGRRAHDLPACDAVGGLGLKPGATLIFGEVHGTAESPRLAGDVACAAAQIGQVQLGVEIWGTEQPAIDHFLASDGATPDRDALLAGAFWHHADGRSSIAMLGLLERARTLRHAGAAIEVVAFDVAPDLPARDQAMASAIAVARARAPKAIFVGLTGNLHSRRIRGTPWDPAHESMVLHLVQGGTVVTSFDVGSDGGTYWACVSKGEGQPQECGVHESHRRDELHGQRWSVGAARDDSHDGLYFVGPTTASPPAVSR